MVSVTAASSLPPAPKRGETKDRIIDSACTCFIEEGISGTSMSRIAAVAGVSRMSLYRHFASKDDVLAAVVSREAAKLLQQLPTINELTGAGTDVLATSFAKSVLFLREHELLQAVMAKEPAFLLQLVEERKQMAKLAISIIAPIFQMQLGVEPGRARRVAEIVFRVMLSLTINPGLSESLNTQAELEIWAGDMFEMVASSSRSSR